MSTPAKKKNARDILEDDIEGYLIDCIESAGGECLKLRPPNGRGFPDRACKLRGFDTFYVETKRPVGGKIAVHQRRWAKRLRAAGSLVFFASNRAEIDAVLTKIKKNKKAP